LHRIEVDAEISLLEENRKFAGENREFLAKHGVVAFNLMGATGSGKTLLIERTADSLGDRLKIGAILGDVAGDDDYRRVTKHGVKAKMVNTGKECHLDAHLIHHAIEEFGDVDLLFMENVGNLVCPVDFDLGEDYRIVIVSVTEGDDVVRKHPEIFRLADAIIINKVSLAEAVGSDVETMVRDARRLNAKAPVIKMDLKTGEGFEEWLEWLMDTYERARKLKG